MAPLWGERHQLIELRRWPAAVLVLATLVGCETFQPASLDSLPPGSRVRALLTDHGAERMGELRRGGDDERVEGMLMSTGPDSLVLEVWRTDLATAAVFDPGRVRVPLGRADVLQISERQFSTLRTGALLAGLAGAAYLLIETIWNGAGGTVDGGGGGPAIQLLPWGG
jgi:hypothetical protein